jgi:hypothetical protein
MAGCLGLRAVLPPGIKLFGEVNPKDLLQLNPKYLLHLPLRAEHNYDEIDADNSPCEAVIRTHLAIVRAHLLPVLGAQKSDLAMSVALRQAVRRHRVKKGVGPELAPPLAVPSHSRPRKKRRN